MVQLEDLPGAGVGGWGPAGIDEVEIPGVPGREINLVEIRALFDEPNGGSGTLTVYFGAAKRWEAPVEGCLTASFPDPIAAPNNVAVKVECQGAKIRVHGYTLPA